MLRRRTTRRGIALIMVLAVVALAAVLSYSVLAGTALQATVGVRSSEFVAAECLAESGVNSALYYLQYPCTVPALADGSSYWQIGNTYWRGGTLSFGAGVPGSATVTVTKASTTDGRTFDIVSTGSVPLADGTPVAHTTRTRVRVSALQPITAAASFRGNFTIQRSLSVTGDVYAPGELRFGMGTVAPVGTTYSPAPPIPMLAGLRWATPTSTMTMPGNMWPADTVNHYLTYEIDGLLCRAQKLSSGTLPSNTVLPGPMALPDPMGLPNPANIYYYDDGPVTLGSNVQINGTLVVINNQLRLNGIGATITAQQDFPAIVADRDLYIAGASMSLTANGVCWVGDGVTRTTNTTGSVFRVRGALLLGNGAIVDAMYPNMVVVTATAGRMTARSLAPIQSAKDLTILSWQP